MKGCKRGYKLKEGKCVKIRKSFSYVVERKKRVFWNFLSGISGLLLGSWMIFYLKNNWGFIPAIIGSLLLIWGDK